MNQVPEFEEEANAFFEKLNDITSEDFSGDSASQEGYDSSDQENSVEEEVQAQINAVVEAEEAEKVTAKAKINPHFAKRLQQYSKYEVEIQNPKMMVSEIWACLHLDAIWLTWLKI